MQTTVQKGPSNNPPVLRALFHAGGDRIWKWSRERCARDRLCASSHTHCALRRTSGGACASLVKRSTWPGEIAKAGELAFSGMMFHN